MIALMLKGGFCLFGRNPPLCVADKAANQCFVLLRVMAIGAAVDIAIGEMQLNGHLAGERRSRNAQGMIYLDKGVMQRVNQ